MSNQVTPEVENEEFKLEVVDDNVGAGEDQALLDLQSKMAELQAENEKLRTAPAVAPDPGLSQLAEILKQMQQPKVEEKPKGPQLDIKKLMEEKNADFYKNPSQSVYELITPVLQQMKTETESEVTTLKVMNSKLSALSIDENKQIYGRYSEEIEEIAKTLPPSTNVYQTAINQVKMNHIQDIVEERAKALAEVSLSEQVRQAEEAAKASVSQPTITSAGLLGQAKPTTAQVTPGQKAQMEAWMLTKGYNKNDPADVSFTYNYFKSKGVIK